MITLKKNKKETSLILSFNKKEREIFKFLNNNHIQIMSKTKNLFSVLDINDYENDSKRSKLDNNSLDIYFTRYKSRLEIKKLNNGKIKIQEGRAYDFIEEVYGFMIDIDILHNVSGRELNRTELERMKTVEGLILKVLVPMMNAAKLPISLVVNTGRGFQLHLSYDKPLVVSNNKEVAKSFNKLITTVCANIVNEFTTEYDIRDDEGKLCTLDNKAALLTQLCRMPNTINTKINKKVEIVYFKKSRVNIDFMYKKAILIEESGREIVFENLNKYKQLDSYWRKDYKNLPEQPKRKNNLKEVSYKRMYEMVKIGKAMNDIGKKVGYRGYVINSMITNFFTIVGKNMVMTENFNALVDAIIDFNSYLSEPFFSKTETPDLYKKHNGNIRSMVEEYVKTYREYKGKGFHKGKFVGIDSKVFLNNERFKELWETKDQSEFTQLSKGNRIKERHEQVILEAHYFAEFLAKHFLDGKNANQIAMAILNDIEYDKEKANLKERSALLKAIQRILDKTSQEKLLSKKLDSAFSVSDFFKEYTQLPKNVYVLDGNYYKTKDAYIEAINNLILDYYFRVKNMSYKPKNEALTKKITKEVENFLSSSEKKSKNKLEKVEYKEKQKYLFFTKMYDDNLLEFVDFAKNNGRINKPLARNALFRLYYYDCKSDYILFIRTLYETGIKYNMNGYKDDCKDKLKYYLSKTSRKDFKYFEKHIFTGIDDDSFVSREYWNALIEEEWKKYRINILLGNYSRGS